MTDEDYIKMLKSQRSLKPEPESEPGCGLLMWRLILAVSVSILYWLAASYLVDNVLHIEGLISWVFKILTYFIIAGVIRKVFWN